MNNRYWPELCAKKLGISNAVEIQAPAAVFFDVDYEISAETVRLCNQFRHIVSYKRQPNSNFALSFSDLCASLQFVP